jgi:hypothetical protein
MVQTKGIGLGHCVSSAGIKVDLSKIEIISKLLVLKTQKYVRSFLGHGGCYRRFTENFTKIASPLFKLLTIDNEFFWSIPCQISFETLKENLSVAPVLRAPNLSLPFHISTEPQT